MRGLGILAIALVACARPTTDAPPRVTPDPIDAAPAPPKKVVPAKIEPAPCTTDADCGWNDRCAPTACVGKSDAGAVACDETLPAPGRCLCARGTCTLARDDLATGARSTGCTSDAQCAFEAPTGSCIAGSGPRAVLDRGGFCACAAGTCTLSWVDFVPCTKDADCSWLDDPPRPVSSKKVPRPPFTPCKGGEHDSACKGGHCEMRFWKC